MSEQEQELHEVTLFLVDKAWRELTEDHQLLEMSRTDVANRAIQLHHLIVQEVQQHDSVLMFARPQKVRTWGRRRHKLVQVRPEYLLGTNDG